MLILITSGHMNFEKEISRLDAPSRYARDLDLATWNLIASQIAAQDVAVIYLETPNCRHTATLAVDSLFLSTLKEQSGRAKAGEVLCMRCGNI